MKNLVFIIISMLLLACATSKKTTVSQAQTRYVKRPTLSKFRGDTLQFINAVLQNKAKYQGKPLSLLLKDIDLPVKFFIGLSPMPKDLEHSAGMHIMFFTRDEIENKLQKKDDPSALVISWQKPISYKETDNILKKNKYFNWTPEVAEYFGKQIVGDIVKTDYFNPVK